MAGKTCAICGKPSGMYPLCFACMKEKNNGNIVKCEECNTWHKINEPCNCANKDQKAKEATESNNLKCIICGENEAFTNSHFCKACYMKYKNKKITILISHCQESKIVDEYGNRDVKTDNGMFVRSQQEKIIYDELYRRGLRTEYEKTFYYMEDGITKDLHPDFYLADYDIYIEHWGYESSNDEKYKESKKYKEAIYKAQGAKIYGTTNEDIKDIKSAIGRILFENGIKTN